MVPLLDLTPAIPEVFLAVAAMALLMVGVFSREADAARNVTPLAILTLGATLVLVVLTGNERQLTFGGHFVSDAFAVYLKAFILLGAAAVLAMSPDYLRREGIDRFEYPILVLFTTLGMMLMVSSNSLLALFVALELQSLPLYVMTAFQRDSARSTEAGLKFFVLGALASGLLLYGCSLVYGFAGTVSFDVLAAVFAPVVVEEGVTVIQVSTGAVVGLVFIAAGLAFKLAAVPFHMWTPDVYEGAPTAVTAFLASAPKVAAIGLMLRVFAQPFGPWVGEWQQIIIFISIASMLLGAFAALNQNNIKRLLAYSWIGHSGYALVGLAAGTTAGIYSVLLYAAIYLIMTVGAFGCVLALRRQGRTVEDIPDFAGLARHQPLLAFAIGVFMFSLAGIPPLAGFFSKLYVFMAAVEAGLIMLAVIGVLTSVVAAYYYLRIVKLMYFDEPAEAYDQPIGREIAWVTGAAAAFNLFFVLYPAPLLTPAGVAAAALFP
jgi:NADH-quinone oxidoreductase subunit N